MIYKTLKKLKLYQASSLTKWNQMVLYTGTGGNKAVS